MSARSRSRFTDYSSGYSYYSSPSSSGSHFNSRYQDRKETCNDYVLPGNSHPFSVERRYFVEPPIVGSGTIRGTVGNRWEYNKYGRQDPNDINFGWPVRPTSLTSDMPSDGALALTLLKRTNPSRPDIGLDVFIGELRELPSLLTKFKGSTLKKIASGNLRYQFGIAPLVSDLRAMLDIPSIVSKRYRELQALQEKGLRRKRRLYQNALSGTPGTIDAVVVGPANKASFRYNTTHTLECWGFVKWFPSPELRYAPSDKLLALAARSSLGLTIDASTAWNLIPWTWLADWFGNFGDYLEYSRNLVPVTHSTPLIMKRIVTEMTYTSISNTSGLSVPSHTKRKWESLSRVSASASLEAQMPLLSLRQLSILGSLAITKYGR